MTTQRLPGSFYRGHGGTINSMAGWALAGRRELGHGEEERNLYHTRKRLLPMGKASTSTFYQVGNQGLSL